MQSEDTWMELHVLHRHGWSIAALAREFGLNWRTARRYASADGAAAIPATDQAGRADRRPSSPTSSGAWPPARTCGRRSSTASSGRATATPARTPACAGGWSSCGRPTTGRARDPLRDRTRDPDPGRLDRLRGLAARRRQPRRCTPSWPSSAARGCSPSASPPTRPGPRPCAAIVRCVDDLGGATAEFLTDRDTALMNGAPRRRQRRSTRPSGSTPRRCSGTRPRACRPYRAKTKGKVERVIREVKEDFLAWLDRPGASRSARPSPGTTRMARRWATEVVASRRHRTTEADRRRGVGRGAAAADARQPPAARPGRGPGRPSCPLPAPSARVRTRRCVGETVEVRPLAVYAELVR